MEFFTLATKFSFKSSCGSASFFNLFVQFVNHAIKRNLAHDPEGEREHRLQSVVATRCMNTVNWCTFCALHIARNI